jgi:hypothetical protein
MGRCPLLSVQGSWLLAVIVGRDGLWKRAQIRLRRQSMRAPAIDVCVRIGESGKGGGGPLRDVEASWLTGGGSCGRGVR